MVRNGLFQGLETAPLIERFRRLVAPYQRSENLSRYTRRVLKRLRWRAVWQQATVTWFGILRPWTVQVESVDYALAQWRAADPHWLDRLG